MTELSERASTRAGAHARTRARAHAYAHARKELRPFLAIDGEAVDDRYVLLAAATRDGYRKTLFDPEGISTVAAFEFLLNLASDEKAIFSAFGQSYDVNMMLRDVPLPTLKELWEMGEVFWEEYYIEWIPGKLFVLTGYEPTRIQFRCFDTFGFFQSSFVKALEAWEVGSDEFLEHMKQERQNFSLDDIEEITRYCLHECELLSELMERVRAALHDVKLYPRTWLGAGAIASTMMSREKVEEHLPRRDERRPPAIEDAILRAYFGGRTELFRQGEFGERTVIGRDINSAYPSEAINLPSMIGRWKRARRYDPSANWAIWRCKWSIPDDAILAPFPFRTKRSIYYPLQGEGYYHAVEVAAALTVYPEHIEVTSGYVFEPSNGYKPFAFIRDVYEERKQLKLEGHPGEKVLKLGINSVYGKLAQGTSRNGVTPRFQDYYWAGRITAGTRAKVMRACSECPEAVIGIATDGIMFADNEPDIPDSSDLGEWERKELRDFFVAQPGMYCAIQEDGTQLVHSRGFFTKEINWDELRQAWREHGPYGQIYCKSHRFVGLGSALMRTDFDIWRTWQDGERVINLYSARKFYENDDEGMSVRRLYPPSHLANGLSDRYIPKRGPIELDDDSADWIAGLEQPLTY